MKTNSLLPNKVIKCLLSDFSMIVKCDRTQSPIEAINVILFSSAASFCSYFNIKHFKIAQFDDGELV